VSNIRRTDRIRSFAGPLRNIAKRGETASPPIGFDLREKRREIKYKGLRWIDIHRPTLEDITYLEQEFGFHPLALDDVMSKIQRPKLDDYTTYIFLVLHFPIYDPSERVAVPSEVDFFMGKDYVVSVHDGQLKPLLSMWARAEEDEESREHYMSQGAEMLLYHIIDRLTNYLFPMMTRIDQKLDLLDERIFRGDPRRAVRDLADYRHDIISIRRIIRPDMLVISQLENGRAAVLAESMQPYWGDVLDHFQKVWDMLGEFRELVETFDDTFNTLYSYRTNETLRILTIISVLLLPLTLISGIWGMNIPLPFQPEFGDNPYSFLAIVILMIVTVLALILAFRRKGLW